MFAVPPQAMTGQLLGAGSHDAGIALPGFEILEKLGQGGMGLVYKARHERLRRLVAIKALPREFSADELRRRRFIQEAQAASALNHPGIVTIYDIVAHDGRDHIVMELVEGRTLGKALRAGRVGTDRAVLWATQVGEALAAAHDKGIVHRDLKPSNVMLCPDGRCKVLDFGLAKLEQDDARPSSDDDASTRLTEVGSVLGTPHYMAPEQALGRAVDARADVFALGVLLYQMLAGRRPFDGDNHIAVLHAICSADPEPLDAADGLPPPLIETVHRALQKSPDGRQQSMHDLVAELRACGIEVGEPGDVPSEGTQVFGAGPGVAAASPPWPEVQTSPTSSADLGASRGRDGRKEMLLKAAGGAAVVVAVLLLIPATRTRLPGIAGTGAPPAAVADEFAAMSALAAYEEGMAALARSDLADNIERSAAAFEAALGKDPEYAAAYAGLARARLRQHASDNADTVLLDQAFQSAARAVQLDDLLAAGHVALGMALGRRGEPEEGRAELERALQLEPRSADALAGIAAILANSNEIDAAIDYYGRALDARPDDWRLYSDLGTLYFGQGRFEEAEAAFDRVNTLTPDNFVAYNSLGAIYWSTGREDEAASAFQRALSITPDSGTYSNLGTLLFYQARYEDAAAAFTRAVDLRSNHYPFWGNLGDAYRWAPGRRAESIDPYRNAIRLVRQRLENQPESATLNARLAEYLAKSGDPDAALALAPAIEGAGSEAPTVWFHLATVYEIAGRRTEALAALRQVLSFGYTADDLAIEPEFTELRRDVRYQQLVLDFQQR